MIMIIITTEKDNKNENTVEPRYTEVLGTMKFTLLYQVSHYIRVKKQKYKELGPAKLPCYKRVLLYPTSLLRGSTVVSIMII